MRVRKRRFPVQVFWRSGGDITASDAVVLPVSRFPFQLRLVLERKRQLTVTGLIHWDDIRPRVMNDVVGPHTTRAGCSSCVSRRTHIDGRWIKWILMTSSCYSRWDSSRSKCASHRAASLSSAPFRRNSSEKLHSAADGYRRNVVTFLGSVGGGCLVP